MQKNTHVFIFFVLCSISHAHNAGEEGGRYSSSTATLLLFVYGTILAGVVLRYLIELLHIPVPFQVFILIIGGILGYVGGIFKEQTDQFLGTIKSKNEYLLIVALPILIYKLCICMEVHSFMRCICQVLIVSIPCTIVNGIVVGGIMNLVMNYSYWTIEYAMMYGFTCVAIYPHETLMKLKDLGAKGKHLSDLLEGEAIFGTTMCIIMIFIALQLQHGIFHGVGSISVFLFQFILGDLVLGFVSGYFLSRLMKMFYNDAINIMIISISAPFMVYYIGMYVLHTCGILALIIVGIFMSIQRVELAPEIDSSLMYFWDLVVLIIDSVVFAVNGVVVGREVMHLVVFADIAKIFIAFMVVYFSRFATFILFSTILSRIEYGISFRHMIVAAWGGVRGAINLCLAMIYFQDVEYEGYFKETVLFHINGLVFLSLLVNVPTIPYMLHCLGISNLSMARQHNMNNCVQHIMAKRDRVIALLRMDRFLADANWSVVDSSTIMKHPYKGSRDVDTDNNFNMGMRGSICPDCHKEVTNQPTKREIEEMRKEARMRVLKAKKISYVKQFQNGMLSKEALAALTHAVEIAHNKHDNYLRIDHLLKLFKKKLFLQQMKNHLTRIFHTRVANHIHRPPRQSRGRKCYNIVQHPAYISITYVMVIVSVSSSGYELSLNDYENEFIHMCSMKALNWAFFIYFFSEIFMTLYGMSYLYICKDGLKTYFRDWWHILDVFLLLVTIADLTIDTLDVLGIFFKYESFQNKTTIFLKLLRLIQLLRVITLCKMFYPLVTRYCDMRIDARMSTIYDIGKGFVKGEEEVMGMLDQMIPNKKVRQEILQTMEHDKLAVTRELGIIQKEKPWIAITVKTKQAIRTILNNMETKIEDLRSSGWIDHIEYKKLMESINERRKFTRNMKMINSCPPKVIFQEISWLGDDNEAFNFLFNQISTKIFEPGDVVCMEGEKSCGVIVIITGLFKSSYKPDRKTIDVLQTYGALPIIDFISSPKFDRNIEEYIVSGNCLGELSFLTGRPYNSTIVADTPSHVYIIPTDLLEEAAKLNSSVVRGLKARMWKFISLRLAISILVKTPAYVACSQEKLRTALERCFVPDLENFTVFAINTMIEDIILIEGTVTDDQTKENFTAPCYIPRTAQKLILVKNRVEEIGVTVNPKLLVIPSKEIDPEEIMEAEEDMLEMFQKSDLMSQYSRSRSSRAFRRKRRGRSSVADSTKSPKIGFADTASSAYSGRSHLTARDFELPEFRKRSMVSYVSHDNTSSLNSNPLLLHVTPRRDLEEDGPSEVRTTSVVMEPDRAERRSRLWRKSIFRKVIDVHSEQSSAKDPINGVQEEEEEKENIVMNKPHPFSIDEEETASSHSEKKSFHKDIP